MKKIWSILLVFLLLLSLSPSAYATLNEPDYMVDYGKLLTAEEEHMLQQRLQEMSGQLQLDIVIVTTYGTGDKEIQQFADDFYDSNGYGYGSDYSGILLVLDMESRQWYMSTCGEAISIFTDYVLDQLGNEMLPWLSSGQYYTAFEVWLNALPSYAEAYRNPSNDHGFVSQDPFYPDYDQEQIYYEPFRLENPFPIALIIGLVAALITVLVMRSKMNTAKLQTGAVNYLKEHSFHLRQRSDTFLYSRVTRTARPKQTTSRSGGSSVHRSSGGRSHGGRGGRF